MFAVHVAVATCAACALAQDGPGAFDPDMEIPGVVTNGVKWIDGQLLPIEGRAFDGTEHYYDRLPTNVTANVNSGVRTMKHHTSGIRPRRYCHSDSYGRFNEKVRPICQGTLYHHWTSEVQYRRCWRCE